LLPKSKVSSTTACWPFPNSQSNRNNQRRRRACRPIVPSTLLKSQRRSGDLILANHRFLIDTATTSTEPVTVVLNWTAELKKQ
jgi:hypothetical protein